MPIYDSDFDLPARPSESNVNQTVTNAIGLAHLMSSTDHVLPGQLLVTELWFEVPHDYGNPAAGKLTLFGRSVNKHEKPIVPTSTGEAHAGSQHPWLVYLEGGPGFGNREPQDVALTRFALNRGYQMLYLDYRGTGLSTPMTADSLGLRGSPQQQAHYLTFFRADNIVRDLEAVRACLTADYPAEKQTWTIFGQSYGGFVALTYLSKHPHGLREAFITGGLAPIGRTPDEVYAATWQRVVERNRAFYGKYPEDAGRVRRLVAHIRAQGGAVRLPAGGSLTARRLLGLGLSFGSHGGLDLVHSLLLALSADLDRFGLLTRASLQAFEQFVSLDTHPLYALLHEAIYCCHRGVASNWAADRMGRRRSEFAWLAAEPPALSAATEDDAQELLEEDADDEAQEPLFFSGEMILPFHLETYSELARLRETANILARFDGWREDLYDEAQLARNEVPVYAASYVDDMYVDFELARQTASKVRGIKVYETNSLYHNAVRARPEEVLGHLFRMRDDVMD